MIDIETNWDYVRVYNGDAEDDDSLLGEFSGMYAGSNLPVLQTRTDGIHQASLEAHSMLLVFSTDAYQTEHAGFEASYSAGLCATKTVLTSSTGRLALPPCRVHLQIHYG